MIELTWRKTNDTNELEAIRSILPKNKQLRELVHTPLMLGIVILVFRGLEQAHLQEIANFKNPENLILRWYVSAMFKRRTLVSKSYNQKQAQKWLQFIAYHMKKSHQSEFYIEQIQPDWLMDTLLIKLYKVICTQIIGLSLSLIIGLSLTFPFIIGIPMESDSTIRATSFVVLGIVFSLVFGIVDFLILIPSSLFNWVGNEIQIIDNVIWKKPSFYSILNDFRKNILHSRMLRFGAYVSMGIFFVCGLLTGLDSGIQYAIIFQVIGAVIVLILGTVDSLFEPKHFVDSSKPTQGIRNSLSYGIRMMLVIGLSGSLFFGLLFGLIFRMTSGLLIGSVLGLSGGLILGILGGISGYGGWAFIQHYVLRFLLYVTDHKLPLNNTLITFMDDMTDHILLNRIGGGWEFKHRLLLEHFAEQFDPAFHGHTKKHI